MRLILITAAASLATGSPPPPPACTYHTGWEFPAGGDGGSVAALNQDECCRSCWADPKCPSAVFANNTCHKKA
eukprot:gene6042-5911_t